MPPCAAQRSVQLLTFRDRVGQPAQLPLDRVLIRCRSRLLWLAPPRTEGTNAMRLHEQTKDGIDLIRLEGDVDMQFAPVLRQVLTGKAKARCPALLLDLTRVEFINSSGLAAILEYLRESADNHCLFCIGGVSGTVRAIVEMVRLDRSMPIFAEVAAAEKAMIAGKLPNVSEPVFARAE